MKGSQDSDFSLVSNKNLNKIFPSSGLGSGPGSTSQKGVTLPHLWHHPQKNESQKIFLHCKLEDSPSLLRVWIALQHNRLASYGLAKQCEIISSLHDFKARYTCTPAPSMLSIHEPPK